MAVPSGLQISWFIRFHNQPLNRTTNQPTTQSSNKHQNYSTITEKDVSAGRLACTANPVNIRRGENRENSPNAKFGGFWLTRPGVKNCEITLQVIANYSITLSIAQNRQALVFSVACKCNKQVLNSVEWKCTEREGNYRYLVVGVGLKTSWMMRCRKVKHVESLTSHSVRPAADNHQFIWSTLGIFRNISLGVYERIHPQF